MSKTRRAVTSMPKRGIRVTRGDASGSRGMLSVVWKYDSEWGSTVWLRPSSGIEITDELRTLTKNKPS